MSFPTVIVRIICDFIPKYKLLDWIDEEKLPVGWLCQNERAMDIIEKKRYNDLNIWQICTNPNAIDYIWDNVELTREYRKALSINPSAIRLLTLHQDLIEWSVLSMNPNAESLLLENIYKIDWGKLSENPASFALKLLKENPDKIDWYALSSNTNPEAIELLRQNPEKINGRVLSANESIEAIELLKEHPHLIHRDVLALNKCAVDFIGVDNIHHKEYSFPLERGSFDISLRNLEHMDIPALASKRNAIRFIKNPDNHVVWSYLAVNPTIFTECLSDSYDVLAQLKW